MSFDLSRQLYPHFRCGKLPCACRYEHKPLEVHLLKCHNAACKHTFYTMGQLQEHHLQQHERPLNVSARMAGMQVNGVHHE